MTQAVSADAADRIRIPDHEVRVEVRRAGRWVEVQGDELLGR